MDTHSDTLARLEKLQIALDSLLREVEEIRAEVRLRSKQTAARELLLILDDVARISGKAHDDTLPLDFGSG